MTKLVIDNTRKSGNFFDNINNYNMFVDEYMISDLSEIKDIVKDTDNFYLVEDDSYNELDDKFKLKYDYINTETLDKFINPEYEKLYKTNYKTMFRLSKEEFKQYIKFCQDHRKCLYEDGKSKFGTIGGGICLEYHINYNNEEYLPFFKFVKCYGCNFTEKITNSDIKLEDKNFENAYENHVKYGNKFDKIEFYRFMEIYKEYKEPLIVVFEGTGLGNIITVKTKNYIYDITNTDSW